MTSPVQIISLPEDVRKGPPPSLPDEEKAFLVNIILSPEKAIDIEKNTTSQSSCSAWYQERAFRITASRFGDVVSRKAPINDKFLHSLFALTKVQTQAMKYGLDMEPTVVKEFKELTGPQVEVSNVACWFILIFTGWDAHPMELFMTLMKVHQLVFWKLRVFIH